MNNRLGTSPVVSAWPEAFRLLRKNPVLFLPLGFSAGAKAFLLALSLVAPFEPFARVLAPAVRYFWGEAYLHYPFHLGLASRWFRRSDMILPVLLDGFLVGVTAILCHQLIVGHPPKTRQAFSETFRRYPAIVLTTTLGAVAMVLLVRAALVPLQWGMHRLFPLGAQGNFLWAFPVAFTTVVVLAAAETFFVFAIPSLVLESRSWVGGLRRSFLAGWRNYWPIFLTLTAVFFGYLPFTLLRQGSLRLVTSAWPESILLVYLARILAAWGLSTLLAVWAAVALLRLKERQE